MPESKKKERKDQSFLNLCAYIEKEIFGYDENQKLQKAAILRLRGLSSGKVIANNKIQSNGNYSFDVVLATFIENKSKILYAIRGKQFQNESNKMGYVCAIIRDKINDVYVRMKEAKQSDEKVESFHLSDDYQSVPEYTNSTKTDNKDKFSELW